MAEVGDILKRKGRNGDGPASVRIVGVNGSDWVVTDATAFAPPFDLSPNALREQYGADGEPPPTVYEPDAWRKVKLDDSINHARLAEREQAAEALTPEQSLAAQAAAELALAK